MNLGYTINDLTEFSLDELTREEAIGLLRGLCRSEDINMSVYQLHFRQTAVEYTLFYSSYLFQIG